MQTVAMDIEKKAKQPIKAYQLTHDCYISQEPSDQSADFLDKLKKNQMWVTDLNKIGHDLVVHLNLNKISVLQA